MKRAQLSTARGKERTQLIAARHARHLSQDEVAAHLGVSKVTVHRWEKAGDVPQPLHLRKLCRLFGKSALELGFTVHLPALEEAAVALQTSSGLENVDDPDQDRLDLFRRQCQLRRLEMLVWRWPSHDARYHMLQSAVVAELEDDTMNADDLMSRRDILRGLALLPIDMSGLSLLGAALKSPTEDILAQCAAGIIACWYLRQGKELALANNAVSTYIPPLKECIRSAPPPHRKAAAGLLAQCFLLKTSLANHINTVGSSTALHYAQQAEGYSEVAENLSLQVLAVRMQANAYDYAERWKQALETTEKAKYLIEANKETTPVPPFVVSFIYAGLANYQSQNGQKQEALRSLGQAYTTFLASSSGESAPAWFPINHSEANLLLTNGLMHFYLGDFKEACDSFMEIRKCEVMPRTTRVEALIDQVLAELQREDAPRDMDRCIDCWTQGVQEARALQSERWLSEAHSAYIAMRAAWPMEKRVKELREHLVHW